MFDLSVNYMGLKLENPLIVGSSPLTDSVEKLVTLEENGAGAVVLKSLYEEELRDMQEGCKCNYHPEAYNYDVMDAEMIYGISNYIYMITDAKQYVNIPVIASLNCVDEKWWEDYPVKIEDAGADGLELNMSYLSFSKDIHPSEIFKKYAEVINKIKQKISIPVAVKISPYSCSIPHMVMDLKNAGADAVVMFARYFKVGIDIETLCCLPVNYYSTPIETYKVLRWVGIVHKQIPNIDICGTTGIHSSNEAIQHLLAGATAFQMVSSILNNGPGVIKEVLDNIKRWMMEKEFHSVDEFRGYIHQVHESSMFDHIHYNQLTEDKFS